MKVLYLIQTHRDPEQIYRLVRIIKQSSPESVIIVSHNLASCPLDPVPLEALPGVTVLQRMDKGGRGDFSITKSYLEALDWVFSQQIEFDWLTNLTGQDYPVRPLSEVEAFLATTPYDGFLDHFRALTSEADDSFFFRGTREATERYLYQYWHSGIYSPLFETSRSWVGKVLYRLTSLFNGLQPFLRICLTFDGLMIGVRSWNSPFNQQFQCYGGNYFHTLSRACVEYLYQFTQAHPDIVEYYRHTCVPNESYFHSVLGNAGRFTFDQDPKRYMNFVNGQDGRPHTLTVRDYDAITQDQVHFARKFDPAQDSQILDLLDARILGHPISLATPT